MDFDSDTDDLPGPLPPRTSCHLQLLRESGVLRSAPAVARAVTSNPSFIQRLTLERKLTGHTGCVNTCAFTPDGNSLISGSDDRLIKLWDWRSGRELLSWESGHTSNVFQARALPEKPNIIVSCAADGQVRATTMRPDGGMPSLCIGGHSGRAHKLALCPDHPFTLLSCGEDGSVTHYDLRASRPGRRLMSLEVPGGGAGYFIRRPLYSIAVNPLRPNEFCLGGGDATVRIFDLRRPAASERPRAVPLCFLSKWRPGTGQAAVAHITAAVYSCRGELLASYAPGSIHLFSAAAAAGLVELEDENAFGSDEVLGRAGRRLLRHGSGRGQSSRGPGRRGEARRLRQEDEGSEEERGGRRQRHRPHSIPAAPRRSVLPPDSYAHVSTMENDANRSPSPPAEDAEPARAAAGAPISPGTDLEPTRPTFLFQMEMLNRVLDNFVGPGGANIMRQLLERAPADGDADEYEAEGLISTESDSESGERGEIGEEGEPSIDPEDEEDDARSTSSASGSSESGGGGGDSSDSGDENDSSNDSSEEEEEDEEVEDAWALPRFANWGPGTAAPPDLRSRTGPLRGGVLQSYTGHVNDFTIKGVSFFGGNDEWVVSGSDDGFIYFWAVATGECVACMKGDGHVVNCLERHPYDLSTLATSGIDDDIKIWGATAMEAAGLSAADRRRMAQQAAQVGDG